MSYKNFLFRQKQRYIYHFSNKSTRIKIAEINRNTEKIIVKSKSYFLKEIDLELPFDEFDFVFERYDLLVNNSLSIGGRYEITKSLLFFCWDDLKVNIKSVSELFIINEIFVEQCYNFLLPEESKVSVIDIGMNVGLASLFFAKYTQTVKIFAFEPFSPTFQSALINFKLNTKYAKKIEPNNYGLGLKNEEVTVPYSESNSGINSTILENPRTNELKAREKLVIKEAKEEIKKIAKFNLSQKFIIKIDTEGAEYDIFESLFSEKLPPNIIGFMMEWHYNGAQRLEKHLLKEGFKIVSTSLSIKAGLIYAFR